jgi:predicted  nucleic acid-binding Zn-ribbon protein
MTSQVEALYQLQKIDLEALEHQKRLASIETQLNDNESLNQAQQAIDKAEETLKPLRTQTRNLDLEIQATLQKSKTSEDRLYSGAVKNPKEMQDLQNEITSLKNRNSQLEDNALELLLTVEEAEATLEQAQADLTRLKAEWDSQHSDLIHEQDTLQTRLQQLSEERERVLKDITAQNRKLYDTMKARKANRPVSIMQGHTCTACGVEQTMAIETAARRRDTLVNCENCGRILLVM